MQITEEMVAAAARALAQAAGSNCFEIYDQMYAEGVDIPPETDVFGAVIGVEHWQEKARKALTAAMRVAKPSMTLDWQTLNALADEMSIEFVPYYSKGAVFEPGVGAAMDWLWRKAKQARLAAEREDSD